MIGGGSKVPHPEAASVARANRANRAKAAGAADGRKGARMGRTSRAGRLGRPCEGVHGRAWTEGGSAEKPRPGKRAPRAGQGVTAADEAPRATARGRTTT